MGDASRAFYFLLECAAAYLHVSNNYMVCCRMGHRKLAEKMIRKALSLLKREFPRTCIGAVVTSQMEKLRWRAYAARRASSLPEVARERKRAWLLQQSCCLSLLHNLFSLEDTSSGPRFSCLAARMMANTQSTAVLYGAEDSHV